MTVEQSREFIKTKSNEKEKIESIIVKITNQLDFHNKQLNNNSIEKVLDKKQLKVIYTDINKLKKVLKIQNNQLAIVNKSLFKESKNLEKKLKPKKELDFIWKISTFIFGIGFIILLFIIVGFKGVNMTWMATSFLLLTMFLLIFIFLIFLAKKTHAILEFKSILSGKPLCLFFTDHKRVDWKVLEPEAGVVHDKKYGSFLINQKGSYIDEKTKSILIPFNPAIATSAPLEAFKLTDSLAKVFNDEKKLAQIRYALANGDFSNSKVMIEIDGIKEELKGMEAIRESIDFSHLKSLMNTLLPHNINSKIEMQVAQRLGGFGKVNMGQIALIIVAIIGATVLAAILLKTVGPSSGGTTTIIKEVGATIVKNATTSSLGG